MSLRKAKQLLEKKKLMEGQVNGPGEEEQQKEEQAVSKRTNANVFANMISNDSSQDQQQSKEPNTQQDNQKETIEKKKKKKKKKNKNQQDPELIQLEKSLKELHIENKKNGDIVEDECEDWQEILSIHESKFNYEKQLRRHFRGWEEEKEEGDPELNKKQQKMQKAMLKQMKKSTLSPGIREFFPIRQKFEVVKAESQNLIKFQWSKKYQQYQAEYDAIRNSNDINALIGFTQIHPEHVDSLYSVGQFLRLRANYKDADDLIQRVIYIYEMSGGYELQEFIKNDLVQKAIVYDPASTSLFMSIFKFMDILGKKGCFRTALEYNKFLLKINLNDPTACLLCMDYNSISSKQYHFLIEFIKHYGRYSTANKNNSIYMLPNFMYSLALAKFLDDSEHQKSKEAELIVEENKRIEELIMFREDHWNKALKLPSIKDNVGKTTKQITQQDPRVLLLRAIIVYPKLIIDIASRNQYAKQFLNHQSFRGWQTKTFKQILEHEFWTTIPTSYSYYFLQLESLEDSQGLDKILEVYVERSKILWKSNQVMLWMKSALGFILNNLEEKKFSYQEYLEELCLENQSTLRIPFLLRRYSKISRANFSDRVDRIDLNNIQDNQQAIQPPQGNPLNMEGNGFQLFLNSLLPWVNLPVNNNHNNDEYEDDPDMPEIEEDD